MIFVADIINVIILGIVEGITEFLPISSTGHLIVTSSLLQFTPSYIDTFNIFIQLGAVVAVLLFYRRDLWAQVKSVTTDRDVQHFWLAIIIAGVPFAIVGFLLRGFVKEHLFRNEVVALSLIVGGIVLIIVELAFSRNKPIASTTQTEKGIIPISFRQAFIIGAFQMFALIPGVSRSASTIIGGLLSGLDRSSATRFSFFLAIPLLGGATIAELVLSLDELQGDSLLYLVIGAVIAGIVAWFVIRWLLAFVAKHTFVGWGVYRIVVGIFILLWTLSLAS